MPTLRYCLAPQCAVLVVAGYCDVHKRDRDATRGSAHGRGYSTRWRRRTLRFRRLYPLCGMRPNGMAPVMSECYELNRATAAEHVDHVVPHHGDEALFWDELGNWQSLCAACHARKSSAGL